MSNIWWWIKFNNISLAILLCLIARQLGARSTEASASGRNDVTNARSVHRYSFIYSFCQTQWRYCTELHAWHALSAYSRYVTLKHVLSMTSMFSSFCLTQEKCPYVPTCFRHRPVIVYFVVNFEFAAWLCMPLSVCHITVVSCKILGICKRWKG